MRKLIFIFLALLAVSATAQTQMISTYTTIKLTKPVSVPSPANVVTIADDGTLTKTSKQDLLSSVAIGDATTASKGIVKLAGDLGGTADAPTVPGLSNKENTITSGTTSQYFRGDKTWQTLPTYTLSGLGGEPSIASGSTSQYWRGDKSWQTLDKSAVGLGNVDNTSDANKPISTAVQTALNGKQATLVSGTNIKTINGNSLLGSGDLSISSGGGTVSSVSGTGSVSGLTLSGTVTSTGSLTLGGALSLTSANVTGALGFTPYNATNPNGYISGITSANVTSALGYTPYNSTNPNGYITSSGRAFPKRADGANVNFNLSGSISTSATGATTILGTENGTDVSNYSTSSLSVGYASSAGSLSNMNLSQFTNNSGYVTAAVNRWYDGWISSPGNDANTIGGSKSGFTYANNAPFNGPIAHFDAGGYGLQFNAAYSGGGNSISYRTRNGDAGAWNVWKNLLHEGNFSSYALPLTGGSLSGQLTLSSIASNDGMVENNTGGYFHLGGWGVARTAPTAILVNTAYRADIADALSNMNISQFTNNSGYITGSYLPLSGGRVSGSITATAFYASSDKRLKNIIARDGDMIQYTWKDKRDTKVHYGYVAQEVKKEMPNQVNKDDKGYLAVNYIEVLVAKVNALEKEVKRLKAKRK